MLFIRHLHMWLSSYLVHSLVLHLAILYNAESHSLWYKSTNLLQNKSSSACFWRWFRPEGSSSKQYPPDFMSLTWRGFKFCFSSWSTSLFFAFLWYPVSYELLWWVVSTFHLFQILCMHTCVHRLFLRTPGGPYQMQEKPLI